MMKHKHTHAMTLRLDPRLDDLVTDASYDKRLSKAAWIRRAIHASLGQRTELPRSHNPAMQDTVMR
jgi:hypothetical protein